MWKRGVLPIVAFASLMFPACARGGDAEVSRVWREWPPAARRLDSRFAQARGTARMWVEIPGRPRKRPPSDSRFAIDHGMEKFELTRYQPTPKLTVLDESVSCTGDGTAFRLFRDAGAKVYRVEGIGTTPKDRSLHISMFRRFVLAHHGVEERDATRLLESPGFSIDRAETVVEDGKTLMRVECGFSVSATDRRLITLVLDPDAGWVIRSSRWKFDTDPGSEVRCDVEYGPARDGFALPRLVRIVDSGGPVNFCEFTDWTFAPTPRSEFSMTHYGLPDLVELHRPRSMLPYALGALAVGAAVAGFAIRRFARRDPKVGTA